MGELQRKVVPDQWRGELQQHEQRVLQLQKAAHKEEGLLARIDELQNGPGCAREVREKLEKLELELSQLVGALSSSFLRGSFLLSDGLSSLTGADPFI